MTGRVITFYSYKGGVGRSMALANIAALLAQRGRKVLVIDFDLEAPGLHRYFLESSNTPRRYEPASLQRGVVDLFGALGERLRHMFPDDEAYCEDDAATRNHIDLTIRELLSSGDYTYRIELQDPNVPAAIGASHQTSFATLDFIPAGKLDDDYAARAHAFDWKAFYRDFAEALPVFTHILAERYDYILIDSRTGITDIGSICTAQLPDVLVLVFAPNSQSLYGAADVGREAARVRREQGQPLLVYPLVTRVENAEEALKQHWIARSQSAFEDMYRREPSSCPFGRGDSVAAGLKAHMTRARVPYQTYYAYGEQIAAERSPTSETGSMAAALGLFADIVDGGGEASAHAAREPSKGGYAEGVILISIGGASIRGQVERSLEALELRDVEIVLDYASMKFLDPEPSQWREQAAAIRDQVKRWVDDPRYERFHLFYRGPVVSAPLLGALIAPNRELNIYYHDNGRYSFAYTLNKRFLKGSQ